MVEGYTSSDERTVPYTDSSDENKFEENKRKYRIVDFDYCQLIASPDKVSSECVICRKEKNKRVKTYLLCNVCKVFCCAGCYDVHRKEQIILALRSFKQKFSNADIKISCCGEYLEVTKSDLSELQTTDNLYQISQYNSSQKTLKNSASSLLISFTINDSVHEQKTTYSAKNVLSYADVKLAVNWLVKNHHVSSEILTDHDSDVKCIYFQDSYMKDYFNFYPEKLCIDIVCNIFMKGIFLYLFINEDSNGHCEIISYSVVASEDENSLLFLLNNFKRHNPCWRKIKLFAIDPCVKYKEIIKNNFPNSCFLMTSHHAVRAFAEGVQNMINISVDKKLYAVKMFQGMATSSNEVEYDMFYQQFKLLHPSVHQYFEETWEIIKHEWRTKIEFNHVDILLSFNNFVTFIENSLKPHLCIQISLYDLLRKFFFILKLLKIEHTHRLAVSLHVTPLSLYSKFTPQFQISKLLTPFAAELVIQQLDFSAEIDISSGVMLENFAFCHLDTNVTANSSICSCKFFMLTLLPCCHVFAVRRFLTLPVFDITLYPYQWTDKYFRDTYCSLKEPLNKQKIIKDGINLDEKFKLVSNLLDQFFFVLSHCQQVTFEHKLTSATRLISAWKKNEKVFLSFEGDEIQNVQRNFTEKKLSNHLSDHDSEQKLTSVVGVPDVAVPAISVVNTVCATDDRCTGVSLQFDGWNFKNNLMGDVINFIFLARVICRSKDECVAWLRSMEFLSNYMLCPSCGSEMKHKYAARLSDGAIWICKGYVGDKKSCAKRCTIRRGTWFEGTNMSLEQILMFIYMWIYGFSQQQIISELGISSATYTVWDKFFQRICEKSISKVNNKSDVNDPEISINKTEGMLNEAPKNKWLQKNEGKDLFLTFLADAAFVHQNDCNDGSESS